jgi:hypothetical protein
MSDKTVSLDYTNALIFELEKALWDERGRGGRFRLTTLGRKFYTEKCLPAIGEADADSIVRTIDEVLRKEGICASLSFNREDRLLRINMQGCIHQAVEKRMVEHGVEPFTCLPANLIVLAIEEKLNRPVELAQIKVEGDGCQSLLVMFDKRPE